MKLILFIILMMLFSGCASWLIIQDYPVEETREYQELISRDYVPIYHNCNVLNCPNRGKIIRWERVQRNEPFVMEPPFRAYSTGNLPPNPFR